jgi:hypothetical protein
VVRLGAPNTRPSSRSPLTTVILIAERFVDAPPGDRILAVDALGVDLEQYGDAVSSPLGHLGRGHTAVKPG